MHTTIFVVEKAFLCPEAPHNTHQLSAVSRQITFTSPETGLLKLEIILGLFCGSAIYFVANIFKTKPGSLLCSGCLHATYIMENFTVSSYLNWFPSAGGI